VIRPSWLWFVLLDGGMVLLATLAFNRRAYERGQEASGDALPPREVLQTMFVTASMVHLVESGVAGRLARRRGLQRPGRWRLQTLVVGFPSLLALRRASRDVV
jgi:Transmembrane protein 254